VTGSLPFDRVADRYDETRGGIERGLRTAADLGPWLFPGPVLEVGVGTGLVATALRDAGHAVYGVDLSPAMLTRARDRLGDRVSIGDARALPVRDRTVSTVVFVAALHAIRDVPAALREAARVLASGGRVAAVHALSIADIDGERDDMTRATASLDPLRLARPDRPDAVDAAASAAGLTRVYAGRVGPIFTPESPAQVAAHIRDRVWSFLWPVDDATWDAVVEPAITALLRLQDPDRPRARPIFQRLAVYSRPG